LKGIHFQIVLLNAMFVSEKAISKWERLFYQGGCNGKLYISSLLNWHTLP